MGKNLNRLGWPWVGFSQWVGQYLNNYEYLHFRWTYDKRRPPAKHSSNAGYLFFCLVLYLWPVLDLHSVDGHRRFP
ncbi:hypothetical protein HAX54_020592, partial [Datura stramonium]|nr:hypothetical protein [Datura stramonium]